MDYLNTSSITGISKSNMFGNLNASKDFLKSNTLAAKVSFILIVVILFILFLKLGIQLLSYYFSENGSPTLIKGMVNANHYIVIKQDPNEDGSVPVLRSENRDGGIEFTWSIWLFIKDLGEDFNKYQHIFHKGNDNINLSGKDESLGFQAGDNMMGINFPNNGPGLYIKPNSNDLLLLMNTHNNILEQITIPDMPLNKWINVIIRCKNTTIDIYVNGTIIKRHTCSGVPRQNYGNVYVAMNGGFSGYISDLKYFNYALGTKKINDIVENGPNSKSISSEMWYDSKPRFLSQRWFFNNSSLSNDYAGL